ncbi:MAG: zinc ribbon domain-containing protein [Clostridia bacterium]|nr:zinc ribbon domain-containing protein [Clostridia bacterium]
MDFFKNLSNSLTKAAEATAKKAGELTDTAKLKLKQNRITTDINDAYTDIGKLIYKQYKESTDESAAIAEKCLAIDKSNEELAAVTAEIEAIKAAAEAAKAQAAEEKAQAAEAADETAAEEAPATEEAPADEAAAETPAGKTCSACGAELPADALFCNKCGQKQD